MMITPPFLKSGDKVGIAAPAGKVDAQKLNFAVDALESWGLEVVLGKNVFNHHHQFAGTDQERIADLQQLLDDTSIKAVLSARGGYGTLRIIDQLDFSNFAKRPKWVVGYSDITVLHAHIQTNFGIETLHAPMPSGFEKNSEALETLRKALFGESLKYDVQHGRESNLTRKGKGIGVLTGGNLSLLYALTGSASDLDTTDKILFIEDLCEYLYHIDRMMQSLKRAGKLEKLKGLIVGGMTEMKDNQIPFGKAAEEIILEAVDEYKYPVCFNFPAGHIDRNFSLILGREVQLEVTETNTHLVF
jgi:muramoyltetrapeptide carboxypeptidase